MLLFTLCCGCMDARWLWVWLCPGLLGDLCCQIHGGVARLLFVVYSCGFCMAVGGVPLCMGAVVTSVLAQACNAVEWPLKLIAVAV